MNILHIATDEKFINQAYSIFEIAFPNMNNVWVITNKENIEFVESYHTKIISTCFIKRWSPKVHKSAYRNYDIVVFHSFSDLLYPEVFNVPEGVPKVWLGWGFDYYDLISNSSAFLLPETQNIASQSYKTLVRTNVASLIKHVFKLIGIAKSKRKAIENLSLFSPVLPGEYEFVRQSQKWNRFPDSVQWNYGTIEDHFVKDFKDDEVNGDSILVGNSASLTCNHKEAISLLSCLEGTGRQVIAPLSYGSKDYGDKIVSLGEQYLGKQFVPLRDFMPIQEYVATIKKCGFVIMNHKRQQAVGNIVIMLYLGARVFLREENPTFSFLKDMGVIVSSVQELEKNSFLLNEALCYEEKQKNKQLVCNYWSRESSVYRTKALVRLALMRGNKYSLEEIGSLCR